MVERVDRELHVETRDEFGFVHHRPAPFVRTSAEAHKGAKQENDIGLLCLRDEERPNVCGDFCQSATSKRPAVDGLTLVGRGAVGATDLATGYFRAPIQYGPVRTCNHQLCVQVIEGGVGATLTDDLERPFTVYVPGEPCGLYWCQHGYQRYLSAEYLALAARRLQQQSLFAEAAS